MSQLYAIYLNQTKEVSTCVCVPIVAYLEELNQLMICIIMDRHSLLTHLDSELAHDNLGTLYDVVSEAQVPLFYSHLKNAVLKDREDNMVSMIGFPQSESWTCKEVIS
jgi:hypothetical protein